MKIYFVLDVLKLRGIRSLLFLSLLAVGEDPTVLKQSLVLERHSDEL